MIRCDDCGEIYSTAWTGNRAEPGRFATDGHVLVDTDQLWTPAALAVLTEPLDNNRPVAPQSKCLERLTDAMSKPATPVTPGALYRSGGICWYEFTRGDGLTAWVNAEKLLLVTGALGVGTRIEQRGTVLDAFVFYRYGDKPAALLMPLRVFEGDDPRRYPRLWPPPEPVHVPDEPQGDAAGVRNDPGGLRAMESVPDESREDR